MLTETLTEINTREMTMATNNMKDHNPSRHTYHNPATTTTTTDDDGIVPHPRRLSYTDEMRLAKFARSHRDLAAFIQEPNATRTIINKPPSSSTTTTKTATVEKSFHGCATADPDFDGIGAIFKVWDNSQREFDGDDPEIRGGLDLTDSIVHPMKRSANVDEGRRKFIRVDAAAWNSFARQFESFGDGDDDEDGDGMKGSGDDDDDKHHHQPHRIPFYACPVQRQRWGDPQLLPHINWGNLFFDLFYVAAAYNLGNFLISVSNESQWKRGLVYFIGIFGVLYNMWERKMNYEAQYLVVDHAHRFLETIRVVLLGFAVLHIKSVALLGDPKSAETFRLTLAILLESLVHIILEIEIIKVGKGDRVALSNHSKRRLVTSLIPLSLFYLAAATVSGILYYGPYSPDVANMDWWGASSNGTTNSNIDGVNQNLGGKTPYPGNTDDWSLADLPLSLCLIGYIFNIVLTAYCELYKIDLRKQDIRDHFIPCNIDFQIHRFGEFTMLMVGEAVLSLLIVDITESKNYYTVQCLGILNVIVIQYLKFGSEPSHANGHCLWRGMKAAYFYSLLIQLLSVGLIAFGVSYKVILKHIFTEEEYNFDGRRLRVLLAVSNVTSNQAILHLYCISLTIVLATMELTANSHKGFKRNFHKIIYKSKSSLRWKVKWRLMFATLFKLILLIFLATLPQWIAPKVNDPTCFNVLSGIGLLISIMFALLQIFDWRIESATREDWRRLIGTINKIDCQGNSEETSAIKHN